MGFRYARISYIMGGEPCHVSGEIIVRMHTFWNTRISYIRCVCAVREICSVEAGMLLHRDLLHKGGGVFIGPGEPTKIREHLSNPNED